MDFFKYKSVYKWKSHEVETLPDDETYKIWLLLWSIKFSVLSLCINNVHVHVCVRVCVCVCVRVCVWERVERVGGHHINMYGHEEFYCPLVLVNGQRWPECVWVSVWMNLYMHTLCKRGRKDCQNTGLVSDFANIQQCCSCQMEIMNLSGLTGGVWPPDFFPCIVVEEIQTGLLCVWLNFVPFLPMFFHSAVILHVNTTEMTGYRMRQEKPGKKSQCVPRMSQSCKIPQRRKKYQHIWCVDLEKGEQTVNRWKVMEFRFCI